MRRFEFEAKALLKGYGIPIPSNKMARSVEEVSIERPSVLKAQIPLPEGGRKRVGLHLSTIKRRLSGRLRESSEWTCGDILSGRISSI